MGKNDSDSGRDLNTSRASLHFNSIESSLCEKFILKWAYFFGRTKFEFLDEFFLYTIGRGSYRKTVKRGRKLTVKIWGGGGGGGGCGEAQAQF